MAVLVKQGRLRIATASFMLLFLALGLGGAYFALRQTDAGKYSAKANELEVLFTGGSSSGSGGERVGLYRTTLAALPKQPLLGSGIGSWSTFYYGSDQRNYPHNLFLEIAFEEGLVGFTAFLALLLLVGLSLYRMIGDSQLHFLALGLVVLYCVIISLFSGDLDDNRLLWLWIGVALSVSRLVHIRVGALRAMRRNARRAPNGAVAPVGSAAYPGPAVSRRYSLRGKDRPWREKFVF
jgi:O-antigen ligase